jgi:hypothetical protein
MALLLILASPHVLLELSGAGARPVHPIRDMKNLVAVIEREVRLTDASALQIGFGL